MVCPCKSQPVLFVPIQARPVTLEVMWIQLVAKHSGRCALSFGWAEAVGVSNALKDDEREPKCILRLTIEELLSEPWALRSETEAGCRPKKSFSAARRT